MRLTCQPHQQLPPQLYICFTCASVVSLLSFSGSLVRQRVHMCECLHARLPHFCACTRDQDTAARHTASHPFVLASVRIGPHKATCCLTCATRFHMSTPGRISLTFVIQCAATLQSNLVYWYPRPLQKSKQTAAPRLMNLSLHPKIKRTAAVPVRPPDHQICDPLRASRCALPHLLGTSVALVSIACLDWYSSPYCSHVALHRQ